MRVPGFSNPWLNQQEFDQAFWCISKLQFWKNEEEQRKVNAFRPAGALSGINNVVK